MSFSSNAEWKYVGVNTTGTSFYVDDTSIKPIKEKLIIRQLQNKIRKGRGFNQTRDERQEKPKTNSIVKKLKRTIDEQV